MTAMRTPSLWSLLRKAFAFTFCAVGLLDAQTTATMLGTVLDPTGAAVPNAQVIATNSATGLARQILTNADGEYLIPALPTGTYSIAVRSGGFKVYSQTGITLQVGQNARVDVRLE